MKKVLSILCAITILATCMTGLSVSASVTYPITESLLNIGTEAIPPEKAVWGGYEHQNFIVPEDWGWRVSENPINANDTATARMRIGRISGSQPTDEHGLILFGSDVYYTKTFDVEPGYTYTIDVDAVTYPMAKYATGVKYWLLHKNLDGTYTDINDFLTQWNYENTELANATGETLVNGASLAEGDYECAWSGDVNNRLTPHSLTVSITDAAVDAIMVGLGGNSGITVSNHGFYRSVTLNQGEEVAIIPNEGDEEKIVYYAEETFASDAYTEETVAWTNIDGESFNHPIHLPQGWSWLVTNAENNSYSQAQDVSDETQRATVCTASDNATYLAMAGSDLALTKMVDIEPGYTYTLSTNVYASYAGAKTSLTYWLYHKNQDGTYTPINEYFAEKNLVSVDNEKVTQIFNSTDGETVTWNGSSTARKGNISLTIDVSSANINAIMVGLGGYGGNTTNQNFRVYHDGFILDRGDTIKIVPDKELYYQETFTEEYIEEEFDYELDETTYKNSVDIPMGWEYSTDGQSPESAVAQKKFAVHSNKPYANGYMIFGSWISLNKMVDIDPGYRYTITTTAATYGELGNQRVNTEVVMYHKNEDGTYTEINEYLKPGNYENYPLENTAAITQLYSADQSGETIDGTYYDATHSVTIEVTDENVNAIMIKLGGNNGMGYNNYGVYEGITVTRDSKVNIIPNRKCYFKDTFTSDYKTENFDFEYEGTTYTNSIDIPAGWSYSTDGQYPNQAVAQKKFAQYMTQIWESGYMVYGAWISLDKMVDIEPGYEYTIKTNAATYGLPSSNRVNTKVSMYHKNEDGTYTEINEYLAANGFQNTTLANSSVNQIIYSATQVSGNLVKGSMWYDATHSVKIQVTDPNVNAIKIELGGHNGEGYNNYGVYRGIAVIQEKAVDMIYNDRPPYLTLETVGEAKVVRYTPAEAGGKAPAIIIAAYAVAEDGSLELAKVSIIKNEATEEGFYDAEYNMDLSNIEGNAKVKAFAWDLAKATPLTRSIVIQ